MHTHRCHGVVIGLQRARPFILGLNLKKKAPNKLVDDARS